MNDFKERLITERSELYEKKEKLSNFVSGENFKKVTAPQQSLLTIQLSAMETYHHCLVQRLAWLDKEETCNEAMPTKQG